MYKCPKCGQVFQGKARFCPNCGQPFVYHDHDEPKTIHVVVHHAYDEEKKPEPAKEEPRVEKPIEEETVAAAEEVKAPADNGIRKKYIASAILGIFANIIGLACAVVSILLVAIVPVTSNGTAFGIDTAATTTVLEHFIATINAFDGSETAIINLVAQGIPLLLAAVGVVFAIVDLIILIVYAARSYDTVGKLSSPEAISGLRGHSVSAHVFPAWAFIFVGALLYNGLGAAMALLCPGTAFTVVDFKWDNFLFTYIAIGISAVELILAIISASVLAGVKKSIREAIVR